VDPGRLEAGNLIVVRIEHSRVDEERYVRHGGSNSRLGLRAKTNFIIARAAKTIPGSQVEVLASVAFPNGQVRDPSRDRSSRRIADVVSPIIAVAGKNAERGRSMFVRVRPVVPNARVSRRGERLFDHGSL